MTMLAGFSGTFRGGFGGIVADGLKVTSATMGKIATSPSPYPSCPGDLELRRHAPGLAEFLGTVTGHSGSTYSLSYGGLNTKPGFRQAKPGETVFLWCTGKGGGGGGGISDVISGDGGGLSPLMLGLIVVGAAFLISNAMS